MFRNRKNVCVAGLSQTFTFKHNYFGEKNTLRSIQVLVNYLQLPLRQ